MREGLKLAGMDEVLKNEAALGVRRTSIHGGSGKVKV